MKVRTLSVVVFATMLAAGCSGAPPDAAPAAEVSAERSPSATEATESPSPTPPEPEPTPNPDGTYEAGCDYLLGGGGGGDGYRFVADAEVKNTGNIGTVFQLRATWFLAGGEKVVQWESVRVKPGRTKRVGTSVDATIDQISAHQSVDGDCKATVAMVDIFGDPT